MESYIVYAADPKKGFVVSASDINHLRAKLIKDEIHFCHVEKRRGDTMKFDLLGTLRYQELTDRYVWYVGNDNSNRSAYPVYRTGRLGRRLF